MPFSLFHSQYIKPLFERRVNGGSLITCSFSSGLRVLFDGILSQLAVSRGSASLVHPAAAHKSPLPASQAPNTHPESVVL